MAAVVSPGKSAGSEKVPSSGSGFLPAEPRTIEETGLGFGFLADLAIKILYFHGSMPAFGVAEAMRLPFVGVVEKVLDFLKKEEFCSVIGSAGLSPAAYHYQITQKGVRKAQENLERCRYAGPAPVPLEAHNRAVVKQSIANVTVGEDALRQAFSHMVLSKSVLDQLGPAINSGKSIFLFGPPGNGKTTIARSIATLLGGDIFIPFSVEADGQIIKVFDPVHHSAIDPSKHKIQGYDRRWVYSKRPVVIVGGELTIDMLDLVYNNVSKDYEAPFQMKANGGMFLIDDFGRQQIRPRVLLNRWVVPLENRCDYFTLHTGKKIEVPFDQLIIFSTNLEPKELVDEAFLRRIRYKIHVGSPTLAEYREIFRRVCEQRGVPYDEASLIYLIKENYRSEADLRACHPRDLVEQLIDTAQYLGVPAALSKQLMDLSCQSYFVRL